MNQKPNSITLDFNIHFESPIGLNSLFKWIVPIAITLIRLAIQIHGGS
jgi:hypothetical protein